MISELNCNRTYLRIFLPFVTNLADAVPRAGHCHLHVQGPTSSLGSFSSPGLSTRILIVAVHILYALSNEMPVNMGSSL